MAVRKVSRRSVSKERWVETLVVADSKMVEYHGSDHVESYILTIMSMVSTILLFFSGRQMKSFITGHVEASL